MTAVHAFYYGQNQSNHKTRQDGVKSRSGTPQGAFYT